MKKIITFVFWGALLVGGIVWLNQPNRESYNGSTNDYIYEDETEETEEIETFRGYECTDDCSGHEAGYNWAEENDISDEYDCDGNSNSFNEGCQAYVEENY